MSGATDAEIIVASWDRPTDFATIFDRHAPAVLSFLERRVGPTMAEDLLADVFRIAFERRSMFDPSRPQAVPWLYGIGANVLRHHRRSQARRLRAVGRLVTETSTHTDDLAPGVATSLDAERALPIVVEALAGLADDDRAVLLMAAFEGLAQADIAAALSIPVGTVKSRLNRARRVLRERLAAGGQFPNDEGAETR